MCTCHILYVLQWPDDGRITAETRRPAVINITYLYHPRIVVLQTVHTVSFTFFDSIHSVVSVTILFFNYRQTQQSLQ
jgi:hypothetical protein